MVLNQQKVIWRLILAVPFLLVMSGCQEDYIEIKEPDATTSFSVADTIGDLILKVTLKDGSYDNIIDMCSETTIEYPYTVRLKNEVVEISDREDIDALLQEQPQERNSIRIEFPVTVSFSDYSTQVISNRGELQKIQNQYKHRLKDDDIESIDFVYPVELNLYDTQYQKPESRLAGNDKQLHGLLQGKAGRIYEIAYPVTLEKFDGTKMEVKDNPALQQAILESQDSYDENDEVEL